MSKIIPVNITTTEQAVTLDTTYQFVWLRNMGENDVLLSDHSGIVAGDDNVTLVKAGESGRITTSGRAVYIKAVSGTSTGEIHAQNFSDAPFNRKAKGGESITVTALNVTENDTYTAPSGTAYSPVTVNVSSGLDYIEQVDYVQTSDSATVGISIPVQPNDIIHLDMQILRHNSEQCVIGNKDYTSELYLNQSSLTRYGAYIDWTADMDMSPVAINERRVYKAEIYLSYNGYVNIMYYGSNPYPTYGNIFGIKVIRNGEEVMNIVPAKMHNVGLGFMYDTINHKIYFSNTGTDFASPTND